jgi:hypothetical protein
VFKSQVRLAEKRGLFKGSLNLLQEEALAWVLIDDAEIAVTVERERMKYTMLAANPQLYKILYNEDEDDDVPRDEDVDWFTPESFEDIDAIEKLLAGVDQEGGETIS